MLGRELCAHLAACDYPVKACSREELDVTSREGIHDAIGGCDLLINCAAWTDVDGAEANEVEAHAVNALGPGLLAEACADRKVRFFHISTDYVFDGTSSEPYSESDPCKPLNAYGRSKHEGEQVVLNSSADSCIIRTQGLYGHHGRNFVDTIPAAPGGRRTVSGRGGSVRGADLDLRP